VEQLRSVWKLAELAIDPGEDIVSDPGGVTRYSLRAALVERLRELCSAGGTASQKNRPIAPSTSAKKKKIASDWGTWRRRSHSTPGRIAAAKVSARSNRITMLRTFQSPNAIATTTTAAAVAFAAVRVTSLACMRRCSLQAHRSRIGKFADELRDGCTVSANGPIRQAR
jgi:hypothetical protein